MKILLTFFFLPFFILAQEEGNTKTHFIALYTIGKSWDAEKPPNEQLYFKEHSEFLSKLREEKTAVLGARYSNTGMVIFTAPYLEAAKALVNSDKAVQNHLFDVEVHVFATFYKGCIE